MSQPTTIPTRLLAMVRTGARRSCSRATERGQGLVEYGLILMLISVVTIVILTVVGNQANNLFSNVSNGLGT